LGRSLDSAPTIPLPPLRPSIPPVLETQAKPPPPSACQLHLREIAVVETLPPVIAENGCGIEDPVKISAVMTRDNGRIAIAPPATLRCATGGSRRHLGAEDIAPIAASLGAPLSAVANFRLL